MRSFDLARLGRLGLGLGLAALLSTGAVSALTIGVIPGAASDSIEAAAVDARAAGMTVEVIEFSDWTIPNVALASGDLDLNYFQHGPFLQASIAATGADLVSVGSGYLPKIGLYSNRHDSLAALPDGATVGVAGDPVNQGRGLQLLQAAGLIKLAEGKGYLVSIDDITENPKNLRLVEVEGTQLVRALDDLDLVQGLPAQIVNAGLAEKAGQALVFSDKEVADFSIQFVTRAEKAEDPEIRQFIEIYHNSAAAREAIHKAFASNDKLYSLRWLQD